MTYYHGSQGAGLLVIHRHTRRVLLFLRSGDVNEPGTWGIAGGAIDGSEDPREAALRELSEEGGYAGGIIVPETPLYVFKDGSFRYYTFLGIVEEEFEPELNWESDDYGWFDLDSLPRPLHPGVRTMLRALMPSTHLWGLRCATT